ncbi:hypothetical protein D4764_04G0015920 [Takifugu flavidus]|uniref:Uncharacterized protein n=1 Tax=Takifugu flavidus TaxID=433684 RepID=A0A5C6N764_9TELE|nr:hypothetical protein D4764_04G0015920 [Takifugu flavidus]
MWFRKPYFKGSVPPPEGEGRLPLIHRGKLQYTGTEPGSNQNCHPCPSPLTIGNSRVVESPTPLEKTGSRALAVRREPVYAAGDQTAKVPAFGRYPTQHMHPTPLAPPAGGEPTGRGSPVASSGCARPDSLGRGPATRRSPTCPTPRPDSRRGPQ